MKRVLIAAATMTLAMFFAPVAGAATVPPSADSVTGEAGSSMEYVQLDTLVDAPASEAKPNPQTLDTPQANPNTGANLSAPAGPEVMNQSPVVASEVVPQAPQQPQAGDVAKISPDGVRPWVAEPITSVPSAVSFILIMALCVGSGVGAALIISWITGKKIDLGLSR